jgi:DNA polymerase III delta subunit
MPTRTPAEVRKQIASRDTDPVYLLQGEDDVEKSALASQFAELVDEGLEAFNVERVHAGTWTNGDALLDGVSALVAAVRTLPMMSPRRVVVVSQAEAMLQPKRESDAAERAIDTFQSLLEQPETMTTLVLVAATLDKRTRAFKALLKSATVVDCGSPADVASAVRWVKARVEAAHVEIDPAGAKMLATQAGFPDYADAKGRTGDVKRLRGEVDRLLLYTLGQKKITVDDVREVMGPAALRDDWEMTNAIESGEAARALTQLSLMFESGAPPEKILGQLGWLVRAKFPQVAPHELASAVESLFRTDLDLKRSGGDPRVLLDRLVVELSGGKRARTGARRW